MTQARPFQVNLGGIVDLLSKHIYSSPRVYLRELLQNGVDAISARRERARELGQAVDENWGIRIRPAQVRNDATGDGSHGGIGTWSTGLDGIGFDGIGLASEVSTQSNEASTQSNIADTSGGNSPSAFILSDDGVGLTASEVTELLATVGGSSKRDLFGMPRSDRLGQFGIGLLSCFMVAEHIRIQSRSAAGGSPIEWVGTADGSFTVREIDDDIPVGTSVYLVPRFDTGELLTEQTVRRLASEFGEFLATPIAIENTDGGSSTRGFDRVNRAPVFLDPDATPGDLAAYCQEIFGVSPLAVLELSAPATGTHGKAFILPFAPPPNARQSARVYLGRMLLTENSDSVLPDWAFFARAVINSTGLSPTASRENLVNDFALETTRAELGQCVRRWLLDLAVHRPDYIAQFLSVHETAIKQLALNDTELASIFAGWLSLETSSGRTPIAKLTSAHPHLRFVTTLDEYRQLVSISRDDSPLVNGGYTFDTELIQLLPSLFPDVTVERVNVLSELDRLDPPPLTEREQAVALEERASRALGSRECRAVVRSMAQQDTPALFVSDPEVFRHLDRGRSSEASGGGLWGQILERTDAFARARHHESSPRGSSDDTFTAKLCLNWSNPLVRSLASLDDDLVLDRSVQLLYVQSRLAGAYPLSIADRNLMTSALGDLVALTAMK